MFQTDAGHFLEISGQVFVIIPEMPGDRGDFQVIVDEIIHVIDDVIVQLFLRVCSTVFSS